MRSLDELRSEAQAAGLEWSMDDSRKELMDKLRDHLTPEGLPQLDPMKAKDLKRKIDWGQPDPYAAIRGEFFTKSHIMEPKLDGCRVRLTFGVDGNTIQTGRRSVRTHAYLQREDNFPLLRDFKLPRLAGTIIDGELLAPSAQITTPTGNTTNSLLNATVALVNSNSAASVATQLEFGWATFHAFDVMAAQGRSVIGLPYVRRRALLERIMAYAFERANGEPLRLIEMLPSNDESLAQALAMGHEGVMVKALHGPYEPGKRSKYWQKIKLMSTFDAFVIGWAPGEGRNEGLVGSLEMGVYAGGTVIPVAQHGVFTDEFRAELTAPDGTLKMKWYGQVMELMGQGVTKDGRVRHPHLIRLRPDKSSKDCDLEQLDSLPRV